MASSEIQPVAQGYNGQRKTDSGQGPIENQDDGRRTTDYGLSSADTTEDAKRISNPESSTPGRFGLGLRDPFRVPPPPRTAMEENDSKFARSRPPGSRGLLIAQLRLKGVVRDSATHKMIAVVTNRSNRAYFLREGEAVYDGMVAKITSEAVYFKENVFDARHEVHPREIVKTLNPATGEAP